MPALIETETNRGKTVLRSGSPASAGRAGSFPGYAAPAALWKPPGDNCLHLDSVFAGGVDRGNGLKVVCSFFYSAATAVPTQAMVPGLNYWTNTPLISDPCDLIRLTSNVHTHPNTARTEVFWLAT